MFFLLRIGFWLTIVALLLPAFTGGGSLDGQARSSDVASVNPVDALAAAGSAMADAGGFCERQPQACAVGVQLLGAVGERVEAAAHLAFAYVLEQISEEKRKAAARAEGTPAGDTLTTHDLTPDWQGPGLLFQPPDAATQIFAPSDGSTPARAPSEPASTDAAVPLPPKKPA